MRKQPWTEWAGALVVIAAAFRYWLLFFNRGTNLLDEGSQAAQALRILHGDLIYRDFFTVVTPGSYYTVAWLFQIFGTNLMVLRWTVLAVGLGILLVSLIAARRLMAWPFAAAAALLTTVWGWFYVTPNLYSSEAMLFALVALVCYLRAAAVLSGRWMVWAGVAAGVSVLIKQNVGAYAAVALLLTIWLSTAFDTALDVRGCVQRSAQFIGGLCAPIVPTLVMLVAAGAGPYLYESWIYYPLKKYPQTFALPFPSFYPMLPEFPTLREAIPAMWAGRVSELSAYEVWIKGVLYLPVIVYPFALAALLVLAIRFHRRDDAAAGREGHALLAVTLFGLLTLLQAWPRVDVTHILFGMQPGFILLAYVSFCCWRGLRRLPGPSLLVSAAAVVITLAPEAALLWKGYQRTNYEYSNYIVALRTDRAKGIFTDGLEAQRIDRVTRYIDDHTAPDDPIFVVPWAAGFYFLADRVNPTRTDFILFEDPESYPCVLARLDAHPPKYVIYGYTWDVDGQHFSDYARPLDDYIRSRYAIEAGVDGYEVWRRIEGASQAPAWPGACQPRRFRLRDFWNPSN